MSKASSATKPFAPKKGTANIVNACPGFKVGKQEDAHEYLAEDKLKETSKKFSQFIQFPIYVKVKKEMMQKPRSIGVTRLSTTSDCVNTFFFYNDTHILS